MTIAFSARLEAGVNEVFPNVLIQKCVFHAIQLLTRGLQKEFIRIKREQLLDHIEEYKILSRYTIALEKREYPIALAPFHFSDVDLAKRIYTRIRNCVSMNDPKQTEKALHIFFSTALFLNWRGKQVFLSKYEDIFIKYKLNYSTRGIKYIIPKVYKGFRAAIRELRKEHEGTKAHFNKVKYLILMNPINMEPHHRFKLRKYLKGFPWLRSYRKLVVKFYYQFRLPPEKRSPLSFLSKLIKDTSHPWLKSAVQTLIENEEKVFCFQQFSKHFPTVKFSKSIKVVNESVNKLVHELHQTQCGQRTLENIRMRVSNRLDCPIIISPALLEKIN